MKFKKFICLDIYQVLSDNKFLYIQAYLTYRFEVTDIQRPFLSCFFIHSFTSCPRQGPRSLIISESHKSIGQFESFVGYIRSSYLTRQEFEP